MNEPMPTGPVPRQYTPGVADVAQLARPDWPSNLSGAVATLRSARRSGVLSPVGRELVQYLADDLRRDVATHSAAQLLRLADPPRPTVNLRDLVLSAMQMGDASPDEQDEVLCAFGDSLSELAVERPDAGVAARVLGILEDVAATLFGTGHVRGGAVEAPATHLSAAAVEQAAVRPPEDVPADVESHLASCQRCQDLVARYRQDRTTTPFHQLPLAD